MKRKKEKHTFWTDFWTFLKPYRRPLSTVYLLHFVNALLNLIPAYSVRYYIDLVLMEKSVKLLGFTLSPFESFSGPNGKIKISLLFLLAIIVLILIANTIGVIMWRKGTWSQEKILYDMKTKIHNHINKLSLGYLNSNRIGDIMTKAVSDVEMVSQLLRNSFFLTYSFVQLMLAPLLMISLSPWLFLVAILPSPLIIYAFYNIRLRLKPLYQEQRRTQSHINSHIQESISGIREVKAFNMEEKSEKVYSDINNNYFNIQNRIMKVFSFNHQLQYGSKDLGIVLIAIVGGIFMVQGFGSISVGIISSFIALSSFLYQPVSSFLGFYDIIQRGVVSLERITGFLKEEEDVKDPDGALSMPTEEIHGRVEYKQVYFGYLPENPVLKNISFTAEPGEKIAIVGPSGSGKSTLLSLLMRFYNTDSGTILIDGMDISQYRQRSVRRNIGAVFQDSFLFYGTIEQNFSFVCPDATLEEIMDACKAANILEDILQLPEGFQTRVGERGVKLSGGQKQRISIARVFLKNPRIVILDEATSAVDRITEQNIQKSIDAMLKGRTAFIIAHRLSTIRECDKILVVKDQRIVESGNHRELIERKGHYQALYTAQTDLVE